MKSAVERVFPTPHGESESPSRSRSRPMPLSAQPLSWDTHRVERTPLEELIRTLEGWRDTDEPMVEAIGDTLAQSARLGSQEKSRRVLDSVIDVLRTNLSTATPEDLWPVTIVPSRYGGVYEPGAWLAFSNQPHELPDLWDAGDVLCAGFWADRHRQQETGGGDSPQAAYTDLVEKLRRKRNGRV